MKISKISKIPKSHSIWLVFSGNGVENGSANVNGFDSRGEAREFLKEEKNKKFSISDIYSRPVKYVRDY
jgi:hypothetical protein